MTQQEIIGLTTGTQYINLTYRDFSIRSGNTSADNATFLMNMRSTLEGLAKPAYEIIFPYTPGGIISSNNRYLYNIARFIVEGNGSLFQTDYSGSDELLVRPFSSGTMFQTNTLTYTGSNTSATPYLFNSVTAGSKTITLNTTSDYANFSVGMMVAIYGFDNVGFGYPPGARFFGRYTITAINTSTGVLTLDRPLKDTYKSTWHDTSGQTPAIGKPRIVPLDRTTGNYCRHAEFRNLTFGAGSSGQSGNLVFAAKTLIMDNVTCQSGYTWASENELAMYTNCNIDSTEWDKLVGKVVVKDSIIRGVDFGGFGCDNIEYDGVQFCRQSSNSAKTVSYKNTIHCSDDSNYALGLTPGFNPRRLATYEGITITSASTSTSNAGIQAATFISLTIAAITGKQILFAYGTESDTNALNVKRMEEGITRLWKNDGTKAGTVTDIANDGTNWIITGTWPAAVVAETWYFCPVKNVIDKGGHVILDGKHFFNDESIRYQGNQSTSDKKQMVLTQNDFNWTANGNATRTCDFHATIQSVEVYISKAYQGTSGKIQLIIDNPTFLYLEFNTKQVGYRKFDKFASNGSKTGDTYDANFFDAFARQIEVDSNSIVGTVTADMLPEFIMTVNWIAP